MKVLDLLKLPEAKKINDLNSSLASEVHRKIIQEKFFLKNIYLDFYKEFKEAMKDCKDGLLVEIGSGSGFIKEIIPNVITTDVFESQGIDLTFHATNMPFKDNSVSVFFLQNVLHHINNPFAFFKEIDRCLVEKGKVVMIEPYNSLWGKFIYKNFHHEPFDTNVEWGITQQGRMTGANGALSWIIFVRDKTRFEKEFPNLKIKKLNPHTPFRYLISGGLSMKQLLPSYMYIVVKGLELILSPLNKYLGMFFTIELKKG